MADKRNNRPRLSREEMHRRFTDIRAIHDGTETPETITQKWKARGMSISLRMVKRYYGYFKPRFESGDDLAELAENYTWSEIVWRLRKGT
jgi:hypothetical protein